METEIWKPVVGYEGKYEISNLGNVRFIYKRLLAPDYTDYRHVRLSKSGYEAQTVTVHSLVAKAFLGLPPVSNMEINHKNGDKYDNKLENLEWVTRAENQAHKNRLTAIGLMNGPPRGEKHWRSKLTTKQVEDIKMRWNRGEKQKHIAEIYKTTQVTISMIVTGRTRKFG